MSSQEFPNSSRNNVRNPKVHYTLFTTTIPGNPFVFLLRYIFVLPFHLCVGRPSGVFPSRLRTRTLYQFLRSYLSHALPITIPSPPPLPPNISKPQSHLVGSTDHNAAHYAVSSSFLSLPPSRPFLTTLLSNTHVTVSV